MTDSERVHDAHDLAAELALGVASGIERARALQHMESCARCRREVADLGEVADELLLVLPTREPPVGFESRVLARVSHPARRSSLWLRMLGLAAAVVVAAGIAGGSVWWMGRDERQAAALFNLALERAGGQYFGAEILRDPAGQQVGHVFAYGGETSWIFGVLRDPPGEQRFTVEVLTWAGERVEVGALDISPGRPGDGLTLPIPLKEVDEVILVPEDGGDVLTAELPAPSGGA
jgi:hypothetical protein